MQSIFFHMVGVSITVSIIIILLLLLFTLIDDRYTVKWRYLIWLLLAVRLLLPVDLGLTSPPLEFVFQDHKITVEDQENGTSEITNHQTKTVEEDSAVTQNNSKKEGNGITLNDEMTGAMASGKTLTFSQILSGIYFLGAATFLIWQFALYLSFHHSTVRWRKELTSRDLLIIFEDLREKMGIKKPLRVEVCRKISSPMIVGLIRPTLLLPHEGYQKIDLEIILKHELVHFKRHDLWFKLLLICANAAHWFNPFIYRMVIEANRDIEISCDEEVLNGADLSLRKRYSERILELMQGNNHREAPISTNFHGGHKMMKSRIKHIFDERQKKRGILSLCLILVFVLIFSACQFDILQNAWKIPLSGRTIDAYGFDKSGRRNSNMSDFSLGIPLDIDRDGKEETKFSLDVSDEGRNSKLTYQKKGENPISIEVFKKIDPGVEYGIQAANMEDLDSIMILLSIDYHGMPFGSGYWELYSWKNGKFEQVDTKQIEENLQMRILGPQERDKNPLDAGIIGYLINDEYPKDYPVAAIYFKDNIIDGKLGGVDYAPMSEYDVEGYETWGQDAINKIMTRMELTNETVEGWNDSSRALLKTEEVVFITLPNITATVTSYYEWKDDQWVSVDRYID